MDRVGALPSATKTSDGGVDRRLSYRGRGSMAVQVKGGRNFGGSDLEEAKELLNRRGTVMVGAW